MIELERERFAHLIAQGSELGPYDDLPVIPAHIDPQVLLSRNDRRQPFFLACERDCVLATLTGHGSIEFRCDTVRRFDVVPGDHVYVPARTPHRIAPAAPMIQIRYKAATPGREAAVWFCGGCETELSRREFDADAEISQAAWWAALESYNADVGARTCEACGRVAPPEPTEGLRWREVAAAIAEEGASS